MGVTMERIEGFVADIDIQADSQADAINAPVVFFETEVPVLLAQEAFFDHYRIKFEKDHNTFEIAPAPPR